MPHPRRGRASVGAEAHTHLPGSKLLLQVPCAPTPSGQWSPGPLVSACWWPVVLAGRRPGGRLLGGPLFGLAAASSRWLDSSLSWAREFTPLVSGRRVCRSAEPVLRKKQQWRPWGLGRWKAEQRGPRVSGTQASREATLKRNQKLPQQWQLAQAKATKAVIPTPPLPLHGASPSSRTSA